MAAVTCWWYYRCCVEFSEPRPRALCPRCGEPARCYGIGDPPSEDDDAAGTGAFALTA